MVMRTEFCMDTAVHFANGTLFCEKGFNQHGYYMYPCVIDGSYHQYPARIMEELKYDPEGYNYQGLNKYEFNRLGFYRNSKEKVCYRGFNCDGIHKKTKTIFDQYGYNRDGFNIQGFKYSTFGGY